MPVADRIKWDMSSDDEIIWKFPSEDILVGAQLIVGEGQEAIFVKGGELLDHFSTGTHTLITSNLPILNKLVNLPFGNKTPFSAEVWFVSKLVKMDIKWGTKSPIQIMDSVLEMPVSVRSFGRWGYKANNVSRIIKKLATQFGVDSSKINEYLYGYIAQVISETIANELTKKNTSILNISTKLIDLSNLVKDKILKSFKEIGIDIVNFNIESINIPDDELKKIQQVYQKTLEARELSKTKTNENFTQIRSFDILDNAASNNSGTGQGLGAMLGAGLGIGAGIPIGNKMGETVNKKADKTDLFTASDKLRELKKLLDEDIITKEQFDSSRKKILQEMND